MRKLLTFGVAAFSLVCAQILYAGAEGSVITWGTPTNISGDSDVNTTGTLVAAFNMFGPDVVVNGVTFSAFNVTAGSQNASNGNFSFSESPGQLAPNNTFGSNSTPFANLSANYKTLLSTAISTTDNNTLTLTISNLIPQANYLFQFWVNASTFSESVGFDTTASAPNLVTLDSNTTDSNGGVGQWVTGTFTAGDVNEFITFTGRTNTQAPTINAFQLRIVPEPSTLSILAIVGAAAGIGTLRRKTS